MWAQMWPSSHIIKIFKKKQVELILLIAYSTQYICAEKSYYYYGRTEGATFRRVCEQGWPLVLATGNLDFPPFPDR